MKINVTNFKEQVRNLNNLKSDYDSLINNYYNNTSDISNYWDNKYSERFKSILVDEKKDMNRIYDDIDSVCSLFELIIVKYSKIGNDINVNFDNMDNIINKLDSCIDRLKKIIGLYKNIDTKEYDSSKIIILDSQRIKLEKELENLNKIKKSVVGLYRDIQECEKEIKNKMSKIKISVISESDISNSVESSEVV